LDREFEEFKLAGGVVGDYIDRYPEESAALYLELGWSPAAVGAHFSSGVIEAAERLNKQRESALGAERARRMGEQEAELLSAGSETHGA
jgi:hypothetical protein